jgi:hypothetical protein
VADRVPTQATAQALGAARRAVRRGEQLAVVSRPLAEALRRGERPAVELRSRERGAGYELPVLVVAEQRERRA